MKTELVKRASELRMKFTRAIGDYYLCSDGVPRKLFNIDLTDEYLVLEFDPVEPGGEAMQYRWTIAKVDEKWHQFTRISQQQAQGKTALPPVKQPESPALPAEVIPQNAMEQISKFIDPDGDLGKITKGLMADFDKVGQGSAYIPQATARMQLAQTVIEVSKTRAMALLKLGKSNL